MDKEALTFIYIEIEKNTFYRRKSLAPLWDVDIEKILVSNKISFSEKKYNTLLVTCIITINLAITYNASYNKPLCKKL